MILQRALAAARTVMVSIDSLVSGTPCSGEATSALYEREKVQALLEAAQRGEVDRLAEAAQQFTGQHIDSIKDGRGRTALHFAAQLGRYQACRYLLEELHAHANGQADTGRYNATTSMSSSMRRPAPHIEQLRIWPLACWTQVHSSSQAANGVLLQMTHPWDWQPLQVNWMSASYLLLMGPSQLHHKHRKPFQFTVQRLLVCSIRALLTT